MEGKDTPELEEARRQLIEAEDEYRRSPTGDYVTMVIRDSAVVEAHRRGMSTDEIRKLVPDLGDRHRAVTRREVVPGGFLSPAEAVRVSRLGPRAFVTAVRDGRIQPVEVSPGVLAFRPGHRRPAIDRTGRLVDADVLVSWPHPTVRSRSVSKR